VSKERTPARKWPMLRQRCKTGQTTEEINNKIQEIDKNPDA
jgi:hypothetical protein